MRKLLLTVGLLIGLVLSAVQARAEVRDDAKFFSQPAVRSADDSTEQMRRDLGKELLIETYPGIPEDRAQSYSPQNKDAFFRDWGNQRAEQAHVDGVYVLINKDPAYLFVTAGNKTRQRDFTQSDENDLRSAMLPLMKQKQYDDALNKAVDFVSSRIRSNRQQNGAAVGAPNAIPPANYYPNNVPAVPNIAPRRGSGFVPLIVIVVIIFIVLRIVRGLFGGISRMGTGYGGYGGPGYGGPGYSGGGGFGRGFLGGILGGVAGNWLGNRLEDRNSNWGGQPPQNFGGQPPTGLGGGGSFNDGGGGDTSFTGGAGGSFDSGSSGSSDSGSSGGGGGDGGAGGSF